MERPWWKFFGRDWMDDRELHRCSIEARGLWITMLCLMNEGNPYGHLSDKKGPISTKVLATAAYISIPYCQKLMDELEENSVFSKTVAGVIFSRRMVKDEQVRSNKAKAGKLGGNPKLLKQELGKVANGVSKQHSDSDSVLDVDFELIKKCWRELWALDPYGTSEHAAKLKFDEIMITALNPEGQAQGFVKNRIAWLAYCEASDLKPVGTLKFLEGDCFKSPPAVKAKLSKSDKFWEQVR